MGEHTEVGRFKVGFVALRQLLYRDIHGSDIQQASETASSRTIRTLASPRRSSYNGWPRYQELDEQTKTSRVGLPRSPKVAIDHSRLLRGRLT